MTPARPITSIWNKDGKRPRPLPLPPPQKLINISGDKNKHSTFGFFWWLFFLKRQSVPQKADTSYTSFHTQTPSFSAADWDGRRVASP